LKPLKTYHAALRFSSTAAVTIRILGYLPKTTSKALRDVTRLAMMILCSETPCRRMRSIAVQIDPPVARMGSKIKIAEQ